MRKIKLKELAGKKAKIVQAPTRKVAQREARREQKALIAAKITQKVEQELVDRLAKGTYGDIYNFEQTTFNKALEQLEDEETAEVESESEEESVDEYVEDLESDDEEESIEEDMEDLEYLGDGKWGKAGEKDAGSEGTGDEDDDDDDDDDESSSSDDDDDDDKKDKKPKRSKKNSSKKPPRRKGSKIEIEYEEENEAQDETMQEAGMAW
jgi:protein MAK16